MTRPDRYLRADAAPGERTDTSTPASTPASTTDSTDTVPARRPPFHLAIPVHDIDEARRFYGDTMGFARGRSAETWTDWDVEGHQLVTHQVAGHRGSVAGSNPVDGHDVPVPHFGLVLDVDRFAALARRLRDAGTDFVIEPYVRFEHEPAEQWTMFFLDPSGNALEFKAFADIDQLFATD